MSQQQLKRTRGQASSLLRFRNQDVLVPSGYVCPLSWRIMIDPVLDPDDPDDRAVDREAFERHQRQFGVRPLTGELACVCCGARRLSNLLVVSLDWMCGSYLSVWMLIITRDTRTWFIRISYPYN